MKKIIQLLTTLAVLIVMSLGGAVVANAAPADDAYKRVASYLGSNPTQNSILTQVSQSWAESLALADAGTEGKTNPAFASNPRPDYTTALAQVPGSGVNATHAVEGARSVRGGANMVNPIYNTVGIGTALAKSGQTYVVITYARVETPPPAPAPAPKPAPAPVIPAPAPVVIPDPEPVVEPEPVVAPKPVVESPKPAPKPTVSPKPTATASDATKPVETPIAPAKTDRQLAKEKAEEKAIADAQKAEALTESERANRAEKEAQETKAWQKQTVTKAGIGFGGVGTIAFLLLPLTRQRKPEFDDEQSEPTVTLDDDDDDWNIGS